MEVGSSETVRFGSEYVWHVRCQTGHGEAGLFRRAGSGSGLGLGGLGAPYPSAHSAEYGESSAEAYSSAASLEFMSHLPPQIQQMVAQLAANADWSAPECEHPFAFKFGPISPPGKKR